MINTAINTILTQIAAMNPLFGDRYFFVDQNEEQEAVTISDNLGNHFFATLPNVASGGNITFAPAQYSGCGSYVLRANINIYFVLDACYRPEKAFDIITNQLAGITDITINNGGYDARSIYEALTGQVLPRQMTILYYNVTLQTETVLGEDCEQTICEETCC